MYLEVYTAHFNSHPKRIVEKSGLEVLSLELGSLTD